MPRSDYRDGYPANPNQTMPILVSGHAYSQDLLTWHYSMGSQPFDPWLIYEVLVCRVSNRASSGESLVFCFVSSARVRTA